MGNLSKIVPSRYGPIRSSSRVEFNVDILDTDIPIWKKFLCAWCQVLESIAH